MKGFLYIIVSIFSILTFAGCGEKSIMDKPVSADNFSEFADKLEELCDRLDNKTCGYVNGALYVYLPDYKTETFAANTENEAKAARLYQRLNGKTPNQIIEIYKGALLENLEKSKRHDEDIVKNLDDMKNVFEKTKRYAGNVAVSHISIDFRKKIPELTFEVTNGTPFNLKQIVAEIEFYTASETFLGREKAFSYPLSPMLPTGKSRSIQVSLSSINDDDMILIKAAKNLKIKVLISSVQTDSAKEEEAVLILALPSSYFKMRELIKESDKLYQDTVKKIRAINKK